MDGIWHWFLALFAFWSADPASIAAERAQAAGLAEVVYASMVRDEKPKPPQGDKPCPTGKCPPGAVLTPGGRAAPAGEATR